MKKIFVLLVIAASVGLGSCQKQQTEQERKAEIDREVQDRLAAERQAQQQQDLAKREADINAREKALADQQGSEPAATVDAQPGYARTTTTSTTERDRGSAVSYDMFYTKLEPYGSWLETPDYGYVWQPRQGQSSNWRPYLNGHWVYTDAGWTWVSDEPFGWATYHYGRWTRLRNVGWIWVPGEEWAPAWVSWRKGDDYVGWAPLPPEARFDRRRGIHNWADNYYDIGPTQYCFVPTRQLGAPRVETTVVPVEQNLTIINRTTNVTNITYSNTTIITQGPNYDELRNRTEQPIPRLRLERQVAVTSQPEAVVRGEVIHMTAPLVEPSRRAEHPPQVRQKVVQSTVDRGWADIGDSDAGRQARAKMKTEATPPPDAPPKTIPKTDVAPAATATATATAATTATPPAKSTTPSELTTSPSPSVAATATVTATPFRISPRPTTTVTPSSSPAVSATPPPARRLLTTPRPTVTPAMSNGSATPAASTTVPQPGTSPAVERPRVGDRLKSQARRLNPNVIEPAPTASQTGTSPEPSVSPGGSPATPPGAGSRPIYERPGNLRRRPSPSGPGQPAAPTSESGVSGSPSPSASPQNQDVTAGQKREDQNRRGSRRHELSSPSPTPSP